MPVDLIFVLDSSGSLGEANWLLVKSLAASIVDQFVISATDTRYVATLCVMTGCI